MKARPISRLAALALVTCGLMNGAWAGAATPADGGKPAVEDLGGGRYRIGNIDIDRNAGSFDVPGVVLAVDTDAIPIEFLAVAKDGMKAYEAAIELDTGAVAFNLACILIGLDAERATRPSHHFDPALLEGDAVDLFVRWGDGEAGRRIPLGDLIRSKGEEVTPDWVYTGSLFGANGVYMAEHFGTLIGVVHDPDSIIQHRRGLGLGDYGAVTVNPATMPAPGTEVVITVVSRAASEEGAEERHTDVSKN